VAAETVVQAAILRDDRLRGAQPVSSSDERNCARAGMRSREFELIGFMESIYQYVKNAGKPRFIDV
jgi:hypothetical protein